MPKPRTAKSAAHTIPIKRATMMLVVIALTGSKPTKLDTLTPLPLFSPPTRILSQSFSLLSPIRFLTYQPTKEIPIVATALPKRPMKLAFPMLLTHLPQSARNAPCTVTLPTVVGLGGQTICNPFRKKLPNLVLLQSFVALRPTSQTTKPLVSNVPPLIQITA